MALPPQMPPMEGASMPEEAPGAPPMPPMEGAPETQQTDPLEFMPSKAREALMQPSEEIGAVLMARLANMSEAELNALDSAITPEIQRILMGLLPELAEIISQVSGEEPMMMAEEEVGALGAMG
jgi:hypothetical protein|tara:strand:- start:1577 stop:1948 length:372 start_codon:yes stop_codon:yes gene_type:complete